MPVGLEARTGARLKTTCLCHSAHPTVGAPASAQNSLRLGAMNIAVISCSLNPDSNSHMLAREAADALRASGVKAELVDLREHAMPLCDGETCTNRCSS